MERLAGLARERGIGFAALPGDDRPDAELDALATLRPADRLRLWDYLVQGGSENAASFLLACRALLDGSAPPPDARPILKAGLLQRDAASSRARGDRAAEGCAPRAVVVFYRALVQSGQTAAVEALCDALAERGLDPLPVFVTSLKDPVSVETLRAIFADRPPAVVVNLTGFARYHLGEGIEKGGGDFASDVAAAAGLTP